MENFFLLVRGSIRLAEGWEEVDGNVVLVTLLYADVA